MRIVAICFAVVMVFICQAQAGDDYVQIMLQAEFIVVPKTMLDTIGRNAPDRLPSAEMVLGLKQSGHATVLHAPAIVTLVGTEATVKAVQEVIYPTDLDVISHSATNGVDRAAIATVVAPSCLETREVGVIFTALPELETNGSDISVIFRVEITGQPVWRKYTALYADSSGNATKVDLDQPFFSTRGGTTTVCIENGATVLVAGGMSDETNETVTYLLIKAQLVNSAGKPVATPGIVTAPR